ncbi:hypothetical protein [Beijerinckia indica]|uniref:Uncharacterized protein n=1 Tax=Beijerinckia indica subsp. indica (strain ATCC 9039 / DSM 1715 / NCIMB 8712) TaxID=395963 RepID=B2IL88_BEII9|nr:hypothetical protein [Beijerinckia indica]ACB97288.1 hypothetical protein Bind_3737 [Beijerinckia indica subsp. indica ATCC 9039]
MNSILVLPHALTPEPLGQKLLQLVVSLVSRRAAERVRIEPQAPAKAALQAAAKNAPKAVPKTVPQAAKAVPVIPLRPFKAPTINAFDLASHPDEAVSDKAIELLLGRGSSSVNDVLDDLLPRTERNATEKALDLKVARAIILHVVAIEIRHIAQMTGLSEATILAIVDAWQNEALEKAA